MQATAIHHNYKNIFLLLVPLKACPSPTNIHSIVSSSNKKNQKEKEKGKEKDHL